MGSLEGLTFSTKSAELRLEMSKVSGAVQKAMTPYRNVLRQACKKLCSNGFIGLRDVMFSTLIFVQNLLNGNVEYLERGDIQRLKPTIVTDEDY